METGIRMLEMMGQGSDPKSMYITLDQITAGGWTNGGNIEDNTFTALNYTLTTNNWSKGDFQLFYYTVSNTSSCLGVKKEIC